MSAGAEGLFRLRELKGEPAEMAVTGGPPGSAEAQNTFTALPPGRSYDDKRIYGLYSGDAMIGAADVVRGWNAPHKAIIGLLLLAERWQHRGIGHAFLALVEQAIAAWPEIDTVRIAVVASNRDALAFWRRAGFRETCEVRPAVPPFIAEIIVLEKPLARAGDAR
jgi:GNAT superfamily N-acetyltransferase